MNSNLNSRSFVVYVHRSPNGKIYVGITSRPTVERWGSSGQGYRENKHFWAAIQKYGWNNFEHKIVASNLSLEEACSLEIELISEYNSIDPEFGYNQTTGGNFSKPSNEVREVLRFKATERWKDLKYRSRMICSLSGHSVSAETRQKLHNAKIGISINSPSPLKGKKLSELHKQKLKGRRPWNLGKTKATDAVVAAYSDKLTGLSRSDISRQRMRKAQKQKFENGYCPMWVNNGQVERYIDKKDLNQYLDKGYSTGRLNKRSIYVYKDEISKKVTLSELDTYLKNGWKRGRPSSVVEHIRNRTQKYTWCYDGQSFQSAEQLAKYLRNNGYPNIVASTITSLYNTGFDTSTKYASLSGKVVRNENFKD